MTTDRKYPNSLVLQRMKEKPVDQYLVSFVGLEEHYKLTKERFCNTVSAKDI